MILGGILTMQKSTTAILRNLSVALKESTSKTSGLVPIYKNLSKCFDTFLESISGNNYNVAFKPSRTDSCSFKG